MKVSIRIAAQEFDISERTLDKWAKSGRIKFERSAGGWRLFDVAEISRVKAQAAVAHATCQNKTKQ